MGDTIQEIEGVVTQIEGIIPTFGGIIGALVPGAAPAMTLAVPVLSIVNEILAAIETLKGTGLAHESAVAVIGTAVTSIGQTLTQSVPPASQQAAAPAAVTG